MKLLLRTVLLLLFGCAAFINLATIQLFESSIIHASQNATASIPPEISDARTPTKTTPSLSKIKTIRKTPTEAAAATTQSSENANINTTAPPNGKAQCRPNVIVYLAQKGNHSSYLRDSYGLLTKSLDLLYSNYLNDHYRSASLLIFHTGDFTDHDLHILEQRQAPQTWGTMQLVDISETTYWKLPSFLQNESLKDWFLPDYTVGYRHMMRWYALKLYEFLRHDWPCRYQYVMRMDEESFIHSKINYDMFHYMQSHQYSYGFRQCSFEMRHMKPLWKEYSDTRPHLVLERPDFVTQDLCGFYNNWFLLDLDWIFQPNVQDWLQWMDNTGYIYRKRINDLIIHTTAVYAFLPPTRIHRFLDFTYEHFTNYKESGCPLWGAISGGYQDDHALERVLHYYATAIVAKHCPRPYEKKPYFPRLMNLSVHDLSPTYHHLSNRSSSTVVRFLPEVAAGHVNLPNVGIRSG